MNVVIVEGFVVQFLWCGCRRRSDGDDNDETAHGTVQDASQRHMLDVDVVDVTVRGKVVNVDKGMSDVLVVNVLEDKRTNVEDDDVKGEVDDAQIEDDLDAVDVAVFL